MSRHTKMPTIYVCCGCGRYWVDEEPPEAHVAGPGRTDHKGYTIMNEQILKLRFKGHGGEMFVLRGHVHGECCGHIEDRVRKGAKDEGKD